VILLLITRYDGLIDSDQAAALARVEPGVIRIWVHRNKLRVAKHENGRNLFEPEDVAAAEFATHRKAGRRADRTRAA
jgi:predicted site-specific integrase-resolvase